MELRHDLLLVRILDEEELFEQVQSFLVVDYSRINAIFWREMINCDRDDLWPGYQILWSHYADHIQPSGILSAVDQMLDHQSCDPLSELPEKYHHEKEFGSRWQLALQIDPEACHWVCNRMNLGQTLIDLFWTGEEHLQVFLDRFPDNRCSRQEDNPTAPDQECKHFLDLFQDNNRAVVYAASSRSYAKTGRQMETIQALVTASQARMATTNQENRLIEDTLRSYHLKSGILLIVDSPAVAYSNRVIKPTLTEVSYCNLQVIGITIGSRAPPTSEKVLRACHNCVTLTQIIWRKQEQKHRSEIETMSQQLTKLSMIAE
jgi:hypothetical protein